MPNEPVYIEKDLAAQVAQGNEHAFRQLFNTYRAKLFTYILKITESKETAEDVVHDVFLKLWTDREKLTTVENINAYLYTMARNHAFNGIKRMAKRTLILAELNRDPDADDTNPGDSLVHKEVRQFIQKTVDRLTPHQRMVYIMSREEGLKQEEIARRLGISIFTVKKHMTDALRFLRQEITRSYTADAVALFVIYNIAF